MKNALDRGNFEPVGVVSFTTSVIDAPLSSQTFVDVNNNLDTVSVGKKKNVKQRYPDPTATSALVNKGKGDGWQIPIWMYIDFSAPRMHRRTDLIGSYMLGYQTFSTGENIQQAVRLKKISIVVSKSYASRGSEWLDGRGERQSFDADPYWLIKGRLYRIEGKTLNGLNNQVGTLAAVGLDSSSVTTLFDLPVSFETEISYLFDIDLIAGVKYAFALYMIPDLPALAARNSEGFSIGNPKLSWSGRGEIQPEGDFSRSFFSDRLGPELTLKADFSTYDSSPTPVLQVQLDIGSVPTQAGEWNILDTESNIMDAMFGTFQKTSISYHAWAGDSLGAKTVDLGAINPSDATSLLISNSKIAGSLRRYYVLEATFAATPNGLRTHSFIKANAIFPSGGGDFSTAALPFTDGPLIEKAPSIPSKIDIASGITKRGTISISIFDLNGELNRKLIESHLLNLPIEYSVGHSDAQSKTDLIQLFSGIIVDYAYKEGVITLKAEDRTVNLSQKIPRTDRTQINRTSPRRTFTGKKLTEVLKSILSNEVLIPDRFVDSASIDAAGAALPSPSRWITHRTLSKEIEAAKLVKDILKLIGAYLVVLEDGVLTAIRYPRLDTSVASWDEDTLSATDTQPMGLRKTIVNQCFTLYDLNLDGEFSGIGGSIDVNAQDEWAPGAEIFVSDRVIDTKWLGNQGTFNGLSIAQAVSKRVVDIHKDGLITYKGQTALNEYAVQVGDYVDITSPAFLRKGELGMIDKQFMVIEKAANFESGKISWTLIEVKNSESPPTASFTATPFEGAPTLNVIVNGSASTANSGTISDYEWDKDYDGENFQVDAAGISPPAFTYDSTATGFKAIALRVRNSFGGEDIETKQIRILGPPVAIISYKVSAPDQTLSVSLFSGSYGITSDITIEEWDLSYDGTTFNPEVLESATSLNLPYQSTTVALRVTDEDGQTAIVTQTFAGKAFAPAQVTGFFVDQNSDKIVFNWNVVGDPDRDSYEIRKGATWNSSVLVASEILSNTFMTVAPLKAGVHTYLVKAINTTGRYSITETAITITIIDPRNRNLIATSDRKSLGWAGTKTGLVYETAKDQWWIASTDDLVSAQTGLVSAQTGILGLRGTRVLGSFEGNPLDLGAVIEGNRFSVDTDSDIIPDPVGTSIVTEFAESDDGIGYTPFAQISAGDLGFRFVKERITLKNDDGASNVSLKSDVLTVDVPDVFDSGEDVVISVGGTTVNFNRNFNSTLSIPRPTLNITIQNMSVPLWYELTAVTTAGFTLKLKRVSDNQDVGGNIDYQAKGF